MDVVKADADMFRPNEFDVVACVFDQTVSRAVVVTEEDAEATDPDHTTGGCARQGLVVGDIAVVVPHPFRIRVRENHGAGGDLHGFHGGPIGGMRTVHDHPDAVHLVDDRSTELGKSGVLVVTAAACLVVEVVGEQCLTHSQFVKQGDHSEVPVQSTHALEVEGHRQPSLGLRLAHVVGSVGDEVAVGV